MKRTLLFLAAGATLALAATPALAANDAAALAAKYAQDAAAATTIEDVHKNMRMALNCLIGPGDEAYVAAEAGQCATGGAIPAADGMAAVSYRLAAQVAKTALALDTLGGAQFAARTAEKLITTTDPTKPDDAGGLATAAPTTATGTIGQVDVANSTLTLGNDLYYVRTLSNDVVSGLAAGQRVELTYVVEDGRRVATSVRKVEAQPGL
jgi:hypothetical protein